MIAIGAIINAACDENVGDENFGKPIQAALATTEKSICLPKPSPLVTIAYST